MKLYEKTAHELAKMIRAKETTVPEIVASVFENIENNECTADTTPVTADNPFGIDPSKPMVALTFDDGPSEHTAKLLDVLRVKNVPATFFALGSRANAFPELIKREADEGHEVESHTMNHKNLTTLGVEGARAEIAGAEQAICTSRGVGDGCVKFVRPPYGEINNTVRNVVEKPMIGWSIDAEDWKSKNPDEMLLRTITKASDGAVILMHDVYDTSVTGAEKIIDALKNEGYTFVTVEEMVQEKGVSLPAGSYYGRFD